MTDSLPSPETISVHLLISGMVQGVGYRYSAQKKAQRLGVAGWVKNLADGRVEAVVEGDPELVEAMMEWCQQGPREAVVQEVKVEYQAPMDLAGFKITR